MRFISRNIPILDVARALDLTILSDGSIRCWRPELHENGDRTASVGIRKTNNTVKCFGCGIGPLSVVDLVIAVLGLKNPGEAARWIASRFEVPELPRGRHLVEPERRIFQFGTESEIGLLVQSGLWAWLSTSARSIVPVLLELSEDVPGTQNRTIQISYCSLSRFAGIVSPNAVAAALRELQQIHWLTVLPARPEDGARPIRDTSTYLITPRSDELVELANANFKQMRAEIDAQKQLRAKARKERRDTLLTK